MKLQLQDLYNERNEPMTVARQLRFLLYGGQVRRFHNRVAMLKDQTDAEHQWSVAMFLLLILGPKDEHLLNLLLAALTHDMGEQVGGDLPSPTKVLIGKNEVLNDLEEEFLLNYEMNFCIGLSTMEIALLKCADYLDGMLRCVYERGMGNKFMSDAYPRFRSRVTQSAENVPGNLAYKVLEFVDELDNLWKEANS